MKHIILISALALTACAHNEPPKVVESKGEAPNAALVVDREVQPMRRNEVILAVKECETSGLRAVMVYSKRKINNYTSDIVVDVSCAPRYR
jgi:hypothetical protein